MTEETLAYSLKNTARFVSSLQKSIRRQRHKINFSKEGEDISWIVQNNSFHVSPYNNRTCFRWRQSCMFLIFGETRRNRSKHSTLRFTKIDKDKQRGVLKQFLDRLCFFKRAEHRLHPSIRHPGRRSA